MEHSIFGFTFYTYLNVIEVIYVLLLGFLVFAIPALYFNYNTCLLYTSDAADD